MADLKIGLPDALYLKPFLYGLQRSGRLIPTHQDYPAKLALMFSEGSPLLQAGCVFLSPIDYGRYGGVYRIVPRVCISSSVSTNTINLYVNQNVRNIRTAAVDIRVTSEIVLAKILLIEKFPAPRRADASTPIQFVPMMPDVYAMLAKADAALVVNFFPHQFETPEIFSLDLVQEWNDLTDLPYVHGIWVGREGEIDQDELKSIIQIHQKGVEDLSSVAKVEAQEKGASQRDYLDYLSSFTYEMSELVEESLSEFFRLCYFHGVLGDVPDLRYFSYPESPTKKISSN